MISNIPVLIVAFKRHLNLIKILEICIESGVTNFYIAVDGPRNSEESAEVNLVKKVVAIAKQNPKLIIRTLIRDKNIGCSASVITACSWFFTNEKFGIVLEDDCIPDITFFKFMADTKKILVSDSNIFSASGLQLLDEPYISDNPMVLCDYAFFWGWATLQDNWFEILNYIIDNPPTLKNFLKSMHNKKEMFWFAGFRRAYMGYADVWDALFTHAMYCLELKSILPGVNLIKNVGNDQYATHSALDIRATNIETKSYSPGTNHPRYLPKMTHYLESEYFKIKSRHRLTIILTYILDIVYPKRQKFEVLSKRIEQNMI